MTSTPDLCELAARLEAHQHRSPATRRLDCTCPACPDIRAAAESLRAASRRLKDNAKRIDHMAATTQALKDERRALWKDKQHLEGCISHARWRIEQALDEALTPPKENPDA